MRIKILCLFITFICLNSCKSNQNIENKVLGDSKNYLLSNIDSNILKNNVEFGQLKSSELIELKNYLKSEFDKNIDSLNYLTISYFKPKNRCWYDNTVGIKNPKNEVYFENIKTQMNSELLIAHYDKKIVSKFSKFDKERLIYKLFSKGYEVCDFTITTNKHGTYYYQASHFNIEVANAFKNALDKLIPLN